MLTTAGTPPQKEGGDSTLTSNAVIQLGSAVPLPPSSSVVSLDKSGKGSKLEKSSKGKKVRK